MNNPKRTLARQLVLVHTNTQTSHLIYACAKSTFEKQHEKSSLCGDHHLLLEDFPLLWNILITGKHVASNNED